jgi:hypothetical protein
MLVAVPADSLYWRFIQYGGRSMNFRRPNENPDGTLIVESNCRTCRRFAYQGHIRGSLQPCAGCGQRLTGFPDTKLCTHYEREPGSDDE